MDKKVTKPIVKSPHVEPDKYADYGDFAKATKKEPKEEEPKVEE